MRSEWLFVGLLLGCGDAIVADTYLGTPAFELGGVVRQSQPTDAENARLSLFWIGFDSRTESRQVVEQRATLDSSFARFDLALFDAPPPEALTFDGAGIALVVVYADRNENGALNSDVRSPTEGPDIVLGASRTHLVVYATDQLVTGRAANVLGTIDPGYHLFETDDSSCHFIEAVHCVGNGVMREVDAETTELVIDLHPIPDAVLVPNPEVPGQSGTDEPPQGSLYGQP